MVSAPSPPDPYQTAAAQTKSNQDTAAYNAALNRVSSYTPYGNLVYSQTGTDTSGAPTWRSDISLTPEAQQQLDNQLKQNTQISNLGFSLADQAGASLANPVTGASVQPLQYGFGVSPVQGAGQGIQSKVDFSGVPSLPGANDYPGLVNQAIAASYNQQKAFLDPQWANARNDQAAQLANQGINVSSDSAAYDRAMGDLGRNQVLAYGNAANQAVGEGQTLQNNLANQKLQANQNAAMQAIAAQEAANNAQNQKFQQNLATSLQNYQQQMGLANLNNSTSAQDLAQKTALATLPINELDAIRSGTQIQNPTFQNAPQSNSDTTNIAGLINQNYQQQMANYNNTMSGLFGLGGGLLTAGLGSGGFLRSDRRLKEGIVHIGTLPSGIPVYEFSYLLSEKRHIGVMAQDVLEAIPEAVMTMRDGFMAVDYSRLH